MKTLVGHARDVDVVRSEEEEEGLGAIGLQPRVGLLDPLVAEIFVAEARGLAAGVKADARNAVVDRGVVAVRPVHLQRGAVRDAGGVVVGRFFIADPERIFRVEIQDAVVFHVNLRDAVVGGGEEKIIIEADLAGAGSDHAVPIGPLALGAETEVPLADDGGFVAGGFGHVGDRERIGRHDEVAVGRRDAGALAAEGVGAGEKRIARGCARRGGAVPLVKRRPSAARRSMFGVLIAVAPLHEMSP